MNGGPPAHRGHRRIAYPPASMEALRTPDDRFADLPDFPFEPHYVEVDAGDGSGDRLRVHYLDEGPPDAAETVAPPPRRAVVVATCTGT